MTEISFARSFLSALDMRPPKLSSDHVADPRTYPSQPAYTLPRLPNQPQKRKRTTSTAAPGSTPAEHAVSVTLKSTKGGEAVVEKLGVDTSVFELKEMFGRERGLQTERVKILFNKKPVADSKTLKDILGDSAESTKDVEFSVMVMGGATASAADSQGPETVPSAQGPSGAEVLGGEEFWRDLGGYLQQRMRSEGDSERVLGIFREAWDKSRA